MADRIPVGLVGVTGYTGMELVRLLTRHPGFELVRATSRTDAGKTLGAIYPWLAGQALADLVLTPPDPADLASACTLAFLAVPHGAAMDMAAELRARDVLVADLSADFRIGDKAVYEAWYKVEHKHAGLLSEAVYGLVELYRERIKGARLLANPGCYPTSVILGLAPALRNGFIETDDIVADSKSGTSGAGRKAAVGTLFCEVSDTFRAYNLTKHRHTPEIEQEISRIAGADLTISFNTHLLPINRGILSTVYTRLKDRATTLEQVHAAYAEFYKDEAWVRVLPAGQLPETRHVRGTMLCDLGVVTDPRTGRLIILSAIDNLCRGASGQALACANLMCGLPESLGLDLAPLMP
jgi:N-acetyl-gamma-glutamyl-phosphate reductase